MSLLKEVLINHLLEHVWANPALDKRFLFNPTLIGSSNGTLNRAFVNNVAVRMPVLGTRFMLYTYGSFEPDVIGIEDELYEWVNLQDLTNGTGLIASMILNHHFIDPVNIYLKRLPNRQLLLAVRASPYTELLKTDHEIFFHLYSNRWFYGENGSAVERPTISSVNVTQAADVLPVYNAYMAAKDAGFYPLLYINGVYSEGTTPSEISVGDTITCVVDKSIAAYWDVPITELNQFISEIDEGDGRHERRFAILTPEEYRGQHRYKDDAEFFLLGTKERNSGPVRNVGFILPTFTKNTINMLSHCDYALETDYVEAVKLQNADEADLVTIPRVRIFIRNNDEGKEIIRDGAKIFLLNVLPEHIRTQFLYGDITTVDEWSAAKIEKSPYLAFNEMNYSEALEAQANPSLYLDGVMSYFEIHHRLEGGILKPGDMYPPIARDGCILKLYDNNGLMMETRTVLPGNAVGEADLVKSVTTPKTYWTHAECIPGVYSNVISALPPIDVNNDHSNELYNEVRYYRDNSGLLYRAVEGSHYTTDPVTRKVNWDPSFIVPNRTFYKRTSADLSDLTYWYAPGDIGGREFVLMLPISSQLGLPKVEVYLAGRYLIRGLDYEIYARDFDGVLYFYIFNKEYLFTHGPGYPARLNISVHGLSEDVDNNYPDDEIGWVRDGLLSNNGTFRYIKNLNKKVYVGGRLLPEDQIRTADLDEGELPEWVENGMPYVVTTRHQHFSTNVVNDMEAARLEDFNKVRELEAVVATRLRQVTPTGDLIVDGQHSLFSLLMDRIINAFKTGEITAYSGMTDGDIFNSLTPVSKFVDLDITITLDEELPVIIHPHSDTEIITVTSDEFSYLQAINRIYFNNRIRLNAGVAIGN